MADPVGGATEATAPTGLEGASAEEAALLEEMIALVMMPVFMKQQAKFRESVKEE